MCVCFSLTTELCSPRNPYAQELLPLQHTRIKRLRERAYSVGQLHGRV